MSPRKKKNNDDEDQQLDQKQSKSKWAALLEKDDQEEEQEDIVRKKKVFDYDFSKEHRLYNQKEHKKKEEPKIVLTPEEQAELERKLQKQRIEKEEKERIKREKKKQKQKVLEKERTEEKIKKEEQQKQQKQLQQLKKKSKSNSDSKNIICWMLVFLVLLGVLQYQKDIYARLSKFKINSEVNYYEVLEVSNGVSEQQLKSAYKKLVMKYHPDKNPNCHSCKDKFNSIMQAWEILGNPQKKKSYDQNSGFLTQIKSETIKLTPYNYDWLVADSDYIWIVQVYDSTSEYCHYFGQFWEQFASKQEGFVRLGRIDVWQQSQMKSYIPYKFQLFPGFYTVHMGEQMLCQFDFEKPYRSLELCIEQRVQGKIPVKIKDWSEIPQSSKIAVILGGGIKLSTPIKLINSQFARYIDFYIMNDQTTTVHVKGREVKFNLNVSTKKTIYKQYRQFLQGLPLQQKSECEILHDCKQRPCLLAIDQQLKSEEILRYPLIQVKEKDPFMKQVQLIKNMTGLFQKFEIGFYQDGKMQLGYLNEVGELSAQNGEVIEFVCRDNSWISKLFAVYEYVSQLFIK